MNFVGKLLVILILVLSVSFLTMGLVVNRTQRDLEAVSNDLRSEVSTAREDYDQLITRHKQLTTQLEREQAAALDQLVKLETEKVALDQRNNALRQEVNELKEQRAEVTSQVAQVQAKNNQLGEEVGRIRDEVESTDEARQDAFAQSLQATEQLHQLQGQLESTLERRRDLREDLGEVQ